MSKMTSAGLLLYRRTEAGLELLIAHPGGPLWARRHQGAWSLPKGLPDPGEALEDAALREFTEETGYSVPNGERIPLGSVMQKSGKVVHAWALEGDADPEALSSNLFEMEWPPRSGRTGSFPEIDRVAWVGPADARHLLNPAQAEFVSRLEHALQPLDRDR
jgi:predicted NUDIX family NTP pyrophosphohydrolase